MTKHLKLFNRKFAFRPETDYITAVLEMRKVIGKYNEKSSPVHCAMVDLTKDFDKVNYENVIRKLRESTLPNQIVYSGLYIFEYKCQRSIR